MFLCFMHRLFPYINFLIQKWIISDAVDKRNEAVPSYDMIGGKGFIRDYAKPAVAGLNHLIDGGGLGDFQTAPMYLPAY